MDVQRRDGDYIGHVVKYGAARQEQISKTSEEIHKCTQLENAARAGC